MPTTALHSHWRITVQGDARAALRKLERLARFKAQDTRLTQQHSTVPTDEVLRHKAEMAPSATRQRLTIERTLRTIALQCMDFRVPHRASAWSDARSEALDMAARIHRQWQLEFHGPHALSARAGDGTALSWPGISHVRSLRWVLRLDQNYSGYF